MPRVKLVLLFGPLRSLVGEEELVVEAESFEDVINKLINKYGTTVKDILFSEKEQGHPFNFFIINGKSLTIEELLKIKLHKDTTIYVWPALDGG